MMAENTKIDDLVAALKWAREALEQTGDLTWEPLDGPQLSVGYLIDDALERAAGRLLDGRTWDEVPT